VIEPKDLPPELLTRDPATASVGPLAGGHVEIHGGGGLGGTAASAGAAPVGGLPASAPPSLNVGAGAGLAAPTAIQAAGPAGVWLSDLQREARRLLESGDATVWDTLTRQFEGQLIRTALDVTRGRRIEAAHKLGIGRNTITRKIQELGLDE
jgi:two-component system nitrogen regulation response regulator GlnG